MCIFMHFANLKADMPGEIRRVADFLEIAIDEAKWPDILKHCSFDYMKANATRQRCPLGGAFWDGGAQTFINKGVNGRWREVLSAEENAAYEKRAAAELGDALRAMAGQGRAGLIHRAARGLPNSPPGFNFVSARPGVMETNCWPMTEPEIPAVESAGSARSSRTRTSSTAL